MAMREKTKKSLFPRKKNKKKFIFSSLSPANNATSNLMCIITAEIMTHTSMYETYLVKTNFKQIMSFCLISVMAKIRCKDSQRKVACE